MSIYRKHRPQTWSAVIGQDIITKTISNQIASGKTAHAYLFSGPRGTGKTTTARLLAKAINCEARTPDSAEPCNQCKTCTDITSGHCMDILEIDAASHTGVDNVRENIIESTQFQPNFAKYKVFIIDEVHMLSNAAFNALLKTLEEPPPHVIFILATTEAHKLPATILSRCEQYNFKRIGADEMRERLQSITSSENINVEDVVLERIIQLSEGCMRDAESLLGQCIATGGDTITGGNVKNILPATYDQAVSEFGELVLGRQMQIALNKIDELHKEGTNWPHFINALLGFFKNALIFKIQNDDKGLFDSFGNKKEVLVLLRNNSLEHIVKLTDTLISRKTQMNTSPIPQLPLELWVAEHVEDNGVTNNPAPESEEKKTPNLVSEQENQESSPSPINHSEPLTTSHSERSEESNTFQNTTNIPEQNQPPQENNNDLDTIQKKWQNCVTYICRQAPYLSIILNSTTVDEWDGEKLIITCAYPLHRDKILEIKTKTLIQNTLREKFSLSALLDGVVKEKKIVQEIKEADETLNELNAALGGQIIG